MVALLVAASLLVIMGFAAVVVDLGAGFSERRQDQSSADVASLAAVQFARGSSNKQTAADNGAAEAMAVAQASLESTLTAADWSGCTDRLRLSTASPPARARASPLPETCKGPGW